MTLPGYCVVYGAYRCTLTKVLIAVSTKMVATAPAVERKDASFWHAFEVLISLHQEQLLRRFLGDLCCSCQWFSQDQQ